jgi:osmoprotectant transport system ATP-binding protein
MAGVEFAYVSYTLPPSARSTAAGTLLRGVTLTLAESQTTALLGRSGSGKTTLLRMVNGLLMPSAGQVLVGGRTTASADRIQLRRSIGYVIQETGLFPHMTVGRNAGMALELDKRSDRTREHELLRLVGLEPEQFAARYPWQLSGGQRQRVGLARALARDPEVLLMDEPFGALDPITRAEMQTMTRELFCRLKKTVLLVTHDLDEALYLADRVVFLAEGEVVADLAPAEVLASAQPHVSEYVRAVRRMVSA